MIKVLNIGNLELTFHLVDPNEIMGDDEAAYIESTADVINLDAVLVVASGNINVSFYLKFPPTTATSSNTSYGRND